LNISSAPALGWRSIIQQALHRLLNEGEMVIKWDRNIKNKGNAILSGLAA